MARARKRQSNNFSKLWPLTGLLVLLLVAGLYYLKNQSDTIKKTLAAKSSGSALQPAHKPEFDFYTILPQSKVTVQSPAAAPQKVTTPQAMAALQKIVSPQSKTSSQPTPAPKKNIANQKILPPLASPPVKIANTGRYQLQVAAVKDFAEVDHFKAALTLSGYNVMVQKITLNNTAWSRISVGPYNSLNLAQAAQARLLKSGTKSIVLKIK